MKRKSVIIQVSLLVVLAVIVGIAGYSHLSPTQAESETRIIHMSTIEPKSTVHVDQHPFPDEQPPEGGGYILHEPDDHGEWTSAVYRFEPGLIAVNEGEHVELHIWGVNGSKHESMIEGYDIPFVVEKGKRTVVEFTADTPGIFNIVCYDHLPAMQSQLLVLPAS